MFRILFFSIWVAFHPVHVTLMSIDYVPEKETFKVFVRLYFDDFIRDCNLTGKTIVEKGFTGGNMADRNAVEDYLRERVSLNVNNRQLRLDLIDFNLVDNEVSMNVVCSLDKKPKTIKVKSLIMTGLYNDQANMVILKVNEFEEGVKLTSEITEQLFKIK